VWSPDGEYFAFVDGDGAATVCESASGETVAPPFGRAIYGVADAYFFYKVALAWRPDGKRIALTTEEAIVIYDWSTGESMATLSNPVHSAWSIAWHPKGNWLASWDREEIHIWDTRTEQVLDSAPAQVYSADLAWRPDGNQLAASFGENVKIWDWDGQSLANPRELSGHSNAVVCVAWSPDGKRLLTGAQDATARIWDSATGQETLAFYEHKTAVFVYWHPDGE
jgi:WD40 repeat protein